MRPPLSFTRRAVAIPLALLAFSAAGCLKGTEVGTPSDPATETFAPSLGVDLSQMTKVSSDLYIQDVVNGSGAQATSGKSVSVFYTGWFVNGTQFDSNMGTSSAFTTAIGVGLVIPGWDLGLVGMHVGGTRRLVIGSDLGYGAAGFPAPPGSNHPSIPPNTTLVFVVQLVAVQ